MKIAVVALTPIALDGRVLRTARTLARSGYVTTVIGREPLPSDTPFRCFSVGRTPSPFQERAELLASQAPATLVPSLAPLLYWIGSGRRQALRIAVQLRPDIVFCNDWMTLPIGVQLKRLTGAKLIYDSHEYAVREHVQNWKWRLVSRRAVSEIERRYIAFADLVVTVSDGIARGLERDYNLPVRPVVVRNLPPFSPAARRRANSRRQILFHGLIRPERGIEELIDSARSWAFDGEIVLRGYGSSHYLELLRTRARGVRHDLLVIEQAVPPDELIRRAALSDVGFLALPASTAHYEFALPNKLFEYLMAGLPVLATPREEISRVLEQTGAGLVTELSAEAIAGTLNSLTPEALAAKSAAALAAAPSLSWEAESTKLTDAIALLQVQTA